MLTPTSRIKFEIGSWPPFRRPLGLVGENDFAAGWRLRDHLDDHLSFWALNSSLISKLDWATKTPGVFHIPRRNKRSLHKWLARRGMVKI